MSVALTDDEAWEVLAAAHTGILTTLRRDGRPIPTPVWFVVDRRSILVAGPRGTAKFSRIVHDPRVAFLVESGERWAELRAVRVDGIATLVDDPDWPSIDAAIDDKYAGHRTPRSEMAPAAARRYDEARALLRIEPDAPLVSWDNARLGPR